MLKEHNQFFLTSQVVGDAFLISSSWFLTSWLSKNDYISANTGDLSIKFGDGGLLFGLNIQQNILDISLFAPAHLIVVLGLLYCFKRVGLYRSFRDSVRFGDLQHLTTGLLTFAFPAWCLTTFKNSWNVSPAFAGTFIGLTFFIVLIFRFFERGILRKMRSKGFNQRHLLIIGAGRLGQDLVTRIQRCRWMGFQVVGYLDDDPQLQKKTFFDTVVLGKLDDIEDILKKNKIDQVYFTLPFDKMNEASYISKVLEKTTADFRIVPDMNNLYTLNTSLFEIDGLPVLGIRENPLQGFSVIQKRCFDIAFSLVALLLLSPLFLLLSVLIKSTSKGSIFFRQKRMGYDGKSFTIFKFRSMATNVENETGPVWAKEGDGRATGLGAFMRKTSLDELPQFFNILLGNMSVVGPRPERPEFISDFKDEIPRYMLRHKTKTGLTGWAQVNGWRGSTSLKKRIQYDLYYIENWSIWFDIRIVIDTVYKGFIHKNAY